MFSRSVDRVLAVAAAAVLFAGSQPAAATVPFVNNVVQSGGFVGQNVAFALAEDGTEHVAYWDIGNFLLVYATRSGSTWSTEIIEASGFAGNEIDLAVDSQGVPHVLWHNFTITTQVLRYANRSGGIWNVETVDSLAADVGRYNAIAIGPGDQPHICYQHVTNLDFLYAVKSGVWMKETVSSAGDRGYFTSIAVDNSGRPHLTDGRGAVAEFYYSFKNAGLFSVLLQDNQFVAGSSISLSNQGHPLIAYSTGGGAQYGDRVGNFIEDVDPNASFSALISMKIDDSGTPHMAYEETFGSRSLTYAKRVSAGSWSVQIVDATGEVGDYPNLDLDRYGNPVIVHYDSDNGDVRIADSRVRLTSALAGANWPVGATRSVSWDGAGTIDIELSTDGGATYQALASGIASNGDGSGDEHEFLVPHTPSRFCKLRVRRSSPLSISESDSLFTIETSIGLLNLTARLSTGDGSAIISWATDPGPEDLGGYRLEKSISGGSWQTLADLTRETSFRDPIAVPGARYRLKAINGLGTEFLLGVTSLRPFRPLSARPLPYRAGTLTITFATSGGLGGGPGHAEVGMYNVEGRLVRRLARGNYSAGRHEVVWDGRDEGAKSVVPGIYFLRSVSGGNVETMKVTVVR